MSRRMGMVFLLLFLVLRLAAQNAVQDSIQKQVEAAGTDSARAFWLGQLCFSYRNTDPDKGLEYGFQAIKMAESLQDKSTLADVYNAVSVMYRRKGEYSEALKYTFRALEIREQKKDSAGMGISYGNIGNLYNNLKQYKEAIGFFTKGVNIFLKQGNKESAAAVYNNIGVSYEKSGALDKALQSYMKSVELLLELKDSLGMAARFNNIGVVYEKQGKPEKALSYQMQALRLQEQGADQMGASISCSNIGNLYAIMKNYEEAIRYFWKSIHLSEEIDDLEGLQYSYMGLSEVYKSRGDYAEALKYYKLQAMFSDSLFNQGNQQQIAELQTRYETQKKEQAIVLLQRDKQLQEAKIARSQTQVYLAIAALLLATVLLLSISRMYRQKQRANERLLQLGKEKNEFLGIAAHDLKNPLQTIIGYCQMQTEYFDKLNREKILKYTYNIELSASRMVGLIVNLLDISAIEQGHIHFNPKPVQLEQWMIPQVQHFERVAAQKEIQLQKDSFAGMQVLADEYMLSQVFENLLSNAIKYSPLHKKVYIGALKDESAGMCGFFIQDEGPGIAEEDMKKLFGKFTRLSARPTAGESSNGLGLSIVKKLTDMMNGQVVCESKAGQGACFKVLLPRA